VAGHLLPFDVVRSVVRVLTLDQSVGFTLLKPCESGFSEAVMYAVEEMCFESSVILNF